MTSFNWSLPFDHNQFKILCITQGLSDMWMWINIITNKGSSSSSAPSPAPPGSRSGQGRGWSRHLYTGETGSSLR